MFLILAILIFILTGITFFFCKEKSGEILLPVIVFLFFLLVFSFTCGGI